MRFLVAVGAFAVYGLSLEFYGLSVVRAQDLPIRVLDISVERHRTIAGVYDGEVVDFAGVRSIHVAPQGKVFATVRVTAACATPDGEGTLEEKHVVLTVGEESPIMLGEHRRDGTAKFFGDIYLYFDADDTTPIRVDPVFLVPEDAKRATFSIAGIKKEINLDVPVATRIKPDEVMKTTVKDVRLVEELPPLSFPQDPIVRCFAPTEGKLLLVTFTILPLVDNQERGYFNADGDAFGLALSDGAYLAPIGSFDGQRLSTPDGGFITRDASGRFPAETLTHVFLIPENTRTAALCYYADPIAEVKIPARSR